MDDFTEERRRQMRDCIAAINYESAVYATDMPPGAPPGGFLHLIRREAAHADALRRKNGRKRPPHYGFLTHEAEQRRK
jgi:hypothetical protein